MNSLQRFLWLQSVWATETFLMAFQVFGNKIIFSFLVEVLFCFVILSTTWWTKPKQESDVHVLHPDLREHVLLRVKICKWRSIGILIFFWSSHNKKEENCKKKKKSKLLIKCYFFGNCFHFAESRKKVRREGSHKTNSIWSTVCHTLNEEHLNRRQIWALVPYLVKN